jgi:hypothetical protein
MPCRRRLALALILAGVVTSARATLQIALGVDADSRAYACVDNAACDLDPAVNAIRIGATTVDDLTFSGSLTSLGMRGFSFVNDQAPPAIAPLFVLLVASDVGFTAGDYAATSLGAFGGRGGSVGEDWFFDAKNEQGAQNLIDVPGAQLTTFSALSAAAPTFTFDEPHTIALADPFSITERAQITLFSPGGSLTDFDFALAGGTGGGGDGGAGGGGGDGGGSLPPAVPEPSTWAMLLTSLVLFGWLYKRRAA